MTWYRTDERAVENKAFLDGLPHPKVLTFAYTTDRVIENLEAINGRHWEKDGKHRIYVDMFDLITASGGYVSYYNTGNISSAAFGTGEFDSEGEPILEKVSNSRASKSKAIYFNVKSGLWNQNGCDKYLFVSLGWVLRRLQGKPEDNG